MSFRFPIKPLQIIMLSLAVLSSSCVQGILLARKQAIQPDAAAGTKEFEKAVVHAVKMPWTNGNQIESLVNGDQIFPSMLRDIRSAKKTITFETYAFANGQVAYKFVNAFCERARSGVDVSLILDSVGAANMGENNLKRMRKAGVDVKLYHPLKLTNLFRYNVRDHRKIMVIDGKTGYSGGCGIGDAWMGNAHTPNHWRENHYRLTGPVVAQLQHGFNDNWVKCGGKLLSGPDYFPRLNRTGNMQAHAYNASPLDKLYTIPHIYRQAIASARKSIIIKNAYVYLDKTMMKAILEARKRGVHVELILSWEHTDSWPVRHLSIHQSYKLLKAGVHIYEYQAAMIHCKVMVVDEIFSIIGSANFDPRSLYINDESNVNVMDKGFAKKQLQIIADDKLRSRRVTKAPSPWNLMTLPSRTAVSVIGPQL